MTIDETRAAIAHLLDDSNPADGMAAYFAFHHPDVRIGLNSYPPGSRRATGYIVQAMTGMDLLRPFVTWRLPPNLEEASELIYQAILPEMPLILYVSTADVPLVSALFDIESVQILHLYYLSAARFEPVVNVLVMKDDSHSNLRRYVIWEADEGGRRQGVAVASLNWQSPNFAEIAVNVLPGYRRRGLGRSVVSALAQDLLGSGQTPLYAVAETNSASIELATQLGFDDTGERLALVAAGLRPRVAAA